MHSSDDNWLSVSLIVHSDFNEFVYFELAADIATSVAWLCKDAMQHRHHQQGQHHLRCSRMRIAGT